MGTMSEDTFVEAEIWSVARTNQGNAILIRPVGADVAVPIFIGPLETQSIVIGLGGVKVPRPLTHDLLLSVLAYCGKKISRVEISDLKEGTFYARLVMEGKGGEDCVDARPSDALAVAVRAKCRVFIAEHVVEEAGVPVDLLMPERQEGVAGNAEDAAMGMDGDAPAMEAAEDLDVLGGQGLSGIITRPETDGGLPRKSEPSMEEERRKLMEALERAVTEEDYEAAAVIRDKLRELEDEL